VQGSSESVEGIYLNLSRVVLQRVTVVKLGVDNGGSDGNGCLQWQIQWSSWI